MNISKSLANDLRLAKMGRGHLHLYGNPFKSGRFYKQKCKICRQDKILSFYEFLSLGGVE